MRKSFTDCRNRSIFPTTQRRLLTILTRSCPAVSLMSTVASTKSNLKTGRSCLTLACLIRQKTGKGCKKTRGRGSRLKGGMPKSGGQQWSEQGQQLRLQWKPRMERRNEGPYPRTVARSLGHRHRRARSANRKAQTQMAQLPWDEARGPDKAGRAGRIDGEGRLRRALEGHCGRVHASACQPMGSRKRHFGPHCATVSPTSRKSDRAVPRDQGAAKAAAS